MHNGHKKEQLSLQHSFTFRIKKRSYHQQKPKDANGAH